MAKIYLAARYSRREELCGYRDALEERGHTVTSRWLDGGHDVDPGDPTIDAEGKRELFGKEDIEDLLASDILISFTEPPETNASSGGRHVEFGICIGIDDYRRSEPSPLNKPWFRLIIVGYRENIFHWLPEVEFYETWEDAFIGLVGA